MRRRSGFCLLVLVGLAIPALAKPQNGLRRDLRVNLDARDASAGTDTWLNQGTLGAFARVGEPKVVTLGGVKAGLIDGKQDAYSGPVTTAALEGSVPRTIAVWVWNSKVDAPEETIVSWRRRGGPDGTMMSLNWGSNGA